MAVARASVPSVALFTGAKVPALGLGTWLGKDDEVKAAVECALDTGYRHIDCAAIYGNEPAIGAAFTEKIGEGKIPREEVFVTSKLWNHSHHPDHVRPALEKTLADLKLTYLDMYLIHWPTAFAHVDDATTFPKTDDGTIRYSDDHYVDTWKAMQACVDAGLVRHIGLSNFNSEQIQEVLDVGGIPPACLQCESQPYLSQERLIDFCKSKNMVFVGYSPLGNPNRPWASADDPPLLEHPEVKAIAAAHDVSAAQVLIRFQIQSGVVPLAKSVTPSRIASNFDVFGFELTDAEMAALKAFDRQWRSCPATRDKDSRFYPFNIPF